MFVKNFLVLVAVLGFSSFASFSFADDGNHSEDVCSRVNPDVCAHLGHMTKLNSTDEVQFVAHLMTPKNEQISNLKIDLWMDMGNGHGHGSSPVTITQFGVNKYKVTDAYFVMQGQWLVRLKFSLAGINHQLDIPVVVE